MYRRRDFKIEVFLVHPGGSFWAKKDLGAWSIPKGEYLNQEGPLEVAKREFKERSDSRQKVPLSDKASPSIVYMPLSTRGEIVW